MIDLSRNGFEVRKLKRLTKKVNQYANQMASLSDEALQKQTVLFRERLGNGETLDDLLPEAFAAIREADKRVLGKFPYDVQVMGGIAMHQGNIAEMKTGEGKTLTATLPLYLNALGKGSTILATTNEYLALRDAKEMGAVYQWMGLTIASGISENPKERLKPKQKRAIYQSDIVYTTHSALGFDYLIDNLADSKEKKFMPDFDYIIIDEADFVLLDAAQTPMIISGAPRVQSNMYHLSDDFVATLEKDIDYRLDEEEENVWLTYKGIEAAEDYFSLEDIYDGQHTELVRHIVLALRARELFEKGKNYVVDDGKVKLLAEKDGRILDMTKLQGGQHQAIETLEKVEITPTMRAMASITYQNLFRMFTKIGGMTGTGKTAESEIGETYFTKVIQIPTNKPIIRKDFSDKIYTTLPEKLLASMSLVKKLHQKGQPILLATESVEVSEIYSEMLLREKISHSVLNAKNAAKEAMIIAEAGQMGAVTIATAMAGRGTDIKLGKGVAELGGLAVIGTEKMPDKRTELQLRGRSGRQGDPGFSQFFVSLEDDVILKHGPRWVQSYYKKHESDHLQAPKSLRSPRMKRVIKRSQSSSESEGEQNRRNTLEFDESVRVQRELIYKERNRLIYQEHYQSYKPESFIEQFINVFLDSSKDLTRTQVSRFIFDHLSYKYKGLPKTIDLSDKKGLHQLMRSLYQKELEEKAQSMATQEEIENFYRVAILKAIDDSWIEEVDSLQQLKSVVSSRQYAQRNPIYEYHFESRRSFKKMQKDIQERIVHNLLLSAITKNKKGENIIYFS